MTTLREAFDYIRDPAAITRRSFEIVRTETDVSRLPADLAPIAYRLVHACGMPEIVDDLAWGGDVAAAGRAALAAGAPVLADCEMLAAGITRARLPADNRVLCTLGEAAVPALAAQLATTRSAAAVDLWPPYLDDAVVAIGNAPTALFRLLEILAAGAPKPAVIVACPVGFVGAAESKVALCEAHLGVPFLTVCGRRGGSALAAAAVNALAMAEP
ncbi:MAG TPA: precorrin-8X methylmutase [Kiloniellales bacterium]|jgi:precorrin isomerase